MRYKEVFCNLQAEWQRQQFALIAEVIITFMNLQNGHHGRYRSPPLEGITIGCSAPAITDTAWGVIGDCDGIQMTLLITSPKFHNCLHFQKLNPPHTRMLDTFPVSIGPLQCEPSTRDVYHLNQANGNIERGLSPLGGAAVGAPPPLTPQRRCCPQASRWCGRWTGCWHSHQAEWRSLGGSRPGAHWPAARGGPLERTWRSSYPAGISGSQWRPASASAGRCTAPVAEELGQHRYARSRSEAKAHGGKQRGDGPGHATRTALTFSTGQRLTPDSETKAHGARLTFPVLWRNLSATVLSSPERREPRNTTQTHSFKGILKRNAFKVIYASLRKQIKMITS